MCYFDQKETYVEGLIERSMMKKTILMRPLMTSEDPIKVNNFNETSNFHVQWIIALTLKYNLVVCGGILVKDEVKQFIKIFEFLFLSFLALLKLDVMIKNLWIWHV